AWLARAYAVAIAAMLVLTSASLAGLRQTRQEATPFKTPFNWRFGGRERPVGLIGFGAIVGLAALTIIVSGDVPSIATALAIAGLAIVLSVKGTAGVAAGSSDDDTFDLLRSADVSLSQIEA